MMADGNDMIEILDRILGYHDRKCPNCGCQCYDPFGQRRLIHDPSNCNIVQASVSKPDNHQGSLKDTNK